MFFIYNMKRTPFIAFNLFCNHFKEFLISELLVFFSELNNSFINPNLYMGIIIIKGRHIYGCIRNFYISDFFKMIAKKIECYKGRPLHIIDEEHLLLFDNKITAMAPDLWDLDEFDWDDPKNQKMLKEEEEARVKKYGRLTSEQYGKIIKIT